MANNYPTSVPQSDDEYLHAYERLLFNSERLLSDTSECITVGFRGNIAGIEAFDDSTKNIAHLRLLGLEIKISTLGDYIFVTATKQHWAYPYVKVADPTTYTSCMTREYLTREYWSYPYVRDYVSN